MRMIEEFLSQADGGIIKNADVLTDDYLPSRLPSREAQIRELVFCIKPAINGHKPLHAWVYGQPGTGKTSTCRYLARQLEYETAIKTVYVNCWENNTYFAVLDKIVRELRILGAERLTTAFKFERLVRFMGEKPYIFILDEIDQPSPKERNAILYNLSRIGHAGIIAICNARTVLASLDDRIRSRLNAEQIEFKPYNADDLVYILEQRAGLALKRGSWDKNILQYTAELAEGDARVAIQTLKNAAYIAEKEFMKKIEARHIREGWQTAKDIKKEYMLNKLTSHHRMLYEIIRLNPGIKSGELWNTYLQECEEKRIRPIAERTFPLYIQKLIETGLIKAERAMVRGKVRIFNVV